MLVDLTAAKERQQRSGRGLTPRRRVPYQRPQKAPVNERPLLALIQISSSPSRLGLARAKPTNRCVGHPPTIVRRISLAAK